MPILSITVRIEDHRPAAVVVGIGEDCALAASPRPAAYDFSDLDDLDLTAPLTPRRTAARCAGT